MTPAEHYAEAERLIGYAANLPAGADHGEVLAAAQVHATLATIDPDVLWPQQSVSVDETAERCICSHAATQHVSAGWRECAYRDACGCQYYQQREEPSTAPGGGS